MIGRSLAAPTQPGQVYFDAPQQRICIASRSRAVVGSGVELIFKSHRFSAFSSQPFQYASGLDVRYLTTGKTAFADRTRSAKDYARESTSATRMIWEAAYVAAWNRRRVRGRDCSPLAGRGLR